MEKKRTLRNRLAAVCICIAVLCTTLFAGTMEVQAEIESWETVQVKVTTSANVTAGKNVTFNLSISNTTDKTVKITDIYTWYYRDNSNSEKWPGVHFGTIKDSKGKVIGDENGLTKSISLASKETKKYKLSGKIPKVWTKKSAITVVINGKSGKVEFWGQGDYYGKDSSTSAKTTVKGTKLTSVKPAKKKATVKWSKQTKGTTGYQIQYSVKKDFKGAKSKEVSSNKKTSLTLKNLKSKKTYYVRIRTYKKTTGGKKYSSWSTAKKAKIK